MTDPYQALNPTVYWYPSQDLNNTDRILGITNTNTSNQAGVSAANGWEFNGTSQFLSYGQNTNLPPTTNSNFTMAFWIKFNATGTRGMMGASIAGSSSGRWTMFLDSSVVGMIMQGSSTFYQTSPSGPSTNIWYHYVGVFNRNVSNGMKLYVDGVQVAQGTFNDTANIQYPSTDPFYFGRYSQGVPAYLNGYIDRAAIWRNRSLTSNEVFNLFEQTKAGKK